MTYVIIIISLLIILILLTLIAKAQKRKAGNYRYQKRASLLTNNEFKFYKDLVKTADSMNLLVFTKVRLADIIEPQKEQNWMAAFNRIRAKHLDFVLCEKQRITPLLAIELNDNSHEREDRKKRDQFVEEALKSANFPILWVTGSTDIAKKIQMFLLKK